MNGEQTMACDVGRESELSGVIGRLDSVLGALGGQIDTMQTRLVPVTRDIPPTKGGGNAEAPHQPGSQVVNKLREFCERGERMNMQIVDTLERLEV